MSIWNREYSPENQERLSKAMLTALNLPMDSPTDYKSHEGSLTHTLSLGGSTSHSGAGIVGGAARLGETQEDLQNGR